MKWVPQPEELFVFRERHGQPKRAVVILVPGGEGPHHVELDGRPYDLDEDMTLLSRAHVRVGREKSSAD